MAEIADLVTRVQGLQESLATHLPARLDGMLQDRATASDRLRDAFDRIDAAIATVRHDFETQVDVAVSQISDAAEAADQAFATITTGLEGIDSLAKAFEAELLARMTAQEADDGTARHGITAFGSAVQVHLGERTALLDVWAHEAGDAAGKLAQAAGGDMHRLDDLRGALGEGRAAASTAMEALSRDITALCDTLRAKVQEGAGTVTADASSRIAGMLDGAMTSGAMAGLQATRALQAPCYAVKQAIGEDLRRAVSTLSAAVEIIRAIRPVLDAAKAIL